MSRAGAAVAALRPAQWLKNAPVLAGIVFGRRLGDGTAVAQVGLAVAAFCLVSSAGYLVNDVADLEADRAHPIRRLRPIARGGLSVPAAHLLAAALALGAAGLSTLLPGGAAVDLGAYAVLTCAYTFVLRRVAPLGLLAVAAGFVLRADAGARAAQVEPSGWLLALTGLLALALAVSKREADARRPDAPAPSSLSRATDTLLALTALGYVAWGLSPDTVALHGTRLLPLTAVPVLAALVRYRRLLRTTADRVGPAERIARDPVLVVSGVVWVLACVLVLGAGSR